MNTRKLAPVWITALLAAGVTGCQDHFSTQEAYEVCTSLTEQNPSGVGEGTFADCVACYETCGGDCEQAGTSPETFVCPDEVDEAGEGGGSGEGGGDGG